MKIGLVRFLNARPLDYGFRERENTKLNKQIEIIEGTPAQLFKLLLDRKLDAALISSVELIRNENLFGYCDKVGICARNKSWSILYIKRREKGFPEPDFHKEIPKVVYVDQGSRTSIALLEILILKATGAKVTIIPKPPEVIPSLVTGKSFGLLIGDVALEFARSAEEEQFDKIDLAEWWFSEYNLPFVFALWAFPAQSRLPDEIFEESLNKGYQNMDKILYSAPFPEARKYLTDILHYRVTESDKLALEMFREEIKKIT